MTERLLQFIWQFQYFNRTELVTVAGEVIQVLSPGRLNGNQGPDFSDARIRIDATTWAGCVELHLRTSGWNKHRHQQDANYNNVILHVVWENDAVVNSIPVVELQGRVPGILLQRYAEWMTSAAFIPCERSIHQIGTLTWQSWKDRLVAERMQKKSEEIHRRLRQNKGHWEEVFWQLLARNFGMRVNADAFEAIARSLPLPLLARHRHNFIQLEALLMGQAGLLEKEMCDHYGLLQQKEYRFLKTKYALMPAGIPVHFLRMRPGNFPSIRLAQLAVLLHQSDHLFSRIRDMEDSAAIREALCVTANDYWHYHYRFGEPSPFKQKKLGASMSDSILINTVAPVLVAYGNYHQEQQFRDKAWAWLGEILAENNSIITGFRRLSVNAATAIDSQALMELKNEYCNRRRCLDCAVGNALLRGR